MSTAAVNRSTSTVIEQRSRRTKKIINNMDVDCSSKVRLLSAEPLEFNLTSSSTSSLHTMSHVSLLECPLCNKARKVLYCKACVNNGDYVRSTAPCTER